jgi:hypothetical protein
MSIKLSPIVSKQLPEFVRDDYPYFVSFIEAYYEYLEQYEKRNLLDTRDIDLTVDNFIQYFKSELNIFGESSYDYINNVLLMRKVKQIYTSKGAEPAYKFIFSVIFGKNVDISYPWDQVLKVSDGKWKQEQSLFLKVLTGDINKIPGNDININSNNAKIKVYVERFAYIRDDIYEVFIDRNYYGTINLTDEVIFEDFTAKILPTTTGYKIEKPGSGFKVGDLITANTISGSITIESLLKVTKVDADGGILKLSTIRFGAGYSDDFFVLLNKVAFTNTSSFSLTKDLAIQFNLPDDSYLTEFNEYGYIVSPNYADPVYSDPTYVGSLLREFYNQTLNNQSNNDYTLVRFNVGPIAKYQGYYISNDGFLDDNIKIQDSYYYQKYSYLLTVDERLQDYATILKSYLHTAGLKLFGEYQIQNNYALNITGQLDVEQYRSKATFNTINKDITNNYISANDAGGKIRINPYDLENYFEITYNPDTYQDFTGQ